MIPRRVAALLMPPYLLIVALIVFSPTPEAATSSVEAVWSWLHNRGAPAWITPRSVEFVMNVVMFMPLGFLGRSLQPAWRWGRWLVVGLGASLAIETTQLLFLPSRSAQVADLVSNTLGAVLGYGLVTGLGRLERGRISQRSE